MKRTLTLDDSELIMVVRKDVTQQIDECRGEMNRTEFVNFLIQNQLKEFHNRQDTMTQDEVIQLVRKIKDSLCIIREILSCCSDNKEFQPPVKALADLTRHLQVLDVLTDKHPEE